MNLEAIFWVAAIGLVVCVALSVFGHTTNMVKDGPYGISHAKYEDLGWATLFLCVPLFVIALVSIISISERHSCSVWAHRNGYEWHYSGVADGCQVNVAGQWIASENVIVNTESVK